MPINLVNPSILTILILTIAILSESRFTGFLDYQDFVLHIHLVNPLIQIILILTIAILSDCD